MLYSARVPRSTQSSHEFRSCCSRPRRKGCKYRATRCASDASIATRFRHKFSKATFFGRACLPSLVLTGKTPLRSRAGRVFSCVLYGWVFLIVLHIRPLFLPVGISGTPSVCADSSILDKTQALGSQNTDTFRKFTLRCIAVSGVDTAATVVHGTVDRC